MIIFVCHLMFMSYSQMYIVETQQQCTFLEQKRGAHTSYAMRFNLHDYDDQLRLRSTCGPHRKNCGTFEEGL